MQPRVYSIDALPYEAQEAQLSPLPASVSASLLHVGLELLAKPASRLCICRTAVLWKSWQSSYEAEQRNLICCNTGNLKEGLGQWPLIDDLLNCEMKML